MNQLTNAFVFLVATLHLGFLILEMFLWKKEFGRKILRMSEERAAATASLAANQGLYNGFLSAGLFLSFFLAPDTAFVFRVFFLGCVIIAGLYGAYSVSARILWLQAAPAVLAFACVIVTH